MAATFLMSCFVDIFPSLAFDVPPAAGRLKERRFMDLAVLAGALIRGPPPPGAPAWEGSRPRRFRNGCGAREHLGDAPACLC